jgi:putative ABC transport system permease protein
MFKQLCAIAMMSLKSLPQRKGNSSVIVLGIAGVVGVLIAVLAMAVGFQHTLADAGRDDRFIALRSGSDTEMNSAILRLEADTLRGMAGIATSKAGEALLSYEVVTIINLPKRDTGAENNVTLRGVGSAPELVRPELKIVSGRMFRPAVRELVVGRSAAKQFSGVSVGSVIHLRNADWTVVGVFESNGDVHESELFADADTVASAIGATGYTSVLGVLASPGALEILKADLAKHTRLKIEVQRESDYLRAQAKGVTGIITTVANSIGLIMAFGAVFGALNSMYAGIADRRKEIATLRAIGFNPSSVMLAVLFEALFLALLGGLLGAGVAWLLFNGFQVSTLGGAYSQVVFQLQVDLPLMVTGITWACLVGLIGGLFPAFHAARQPIVDGLRAN